MLIAKPEVRRRWPNHATKPASPSGVLTNSYTLDCAFSLEIAQPSSEGSPHLGHRSGAGIVGGRLLMLMIVTECSSQLSHSSTQQLFIIYSCAGQAGSPPQFKDS